MNCEHVHLIRVEEIGGGLRQPQDGVYTYYCQDCKTTLYLRFTDAPPVVVRYGKPTP
jgi:hypothetical protein